MNISRYRMDYTYLTFFCNMNGMTVSRVGGYTYSEDPLAVKSRVFVGHLNTFRCTKNDVERIFQHYGCITGVTVKEGYAFVQFTNPFDARSACMGENNRFVYGRKIAVSLVSEYRERMGVQKRPISNIGETDPFATPRIGFGISAPGRLLVSSKRPRLAETSTAVSRNNQPAITSAGESIDELKTYSNPDILICGNCREMFAEMKQLMDHKKNFCKLRFTCKCDDVARNNESPNRGSLVCIKCKEPFPNAWDLMVHVQTTHLMDIYELGSAPANVQTVKHRAIEVINLDDDDDEAEIIETKPEMPSASHEKVSFRITRHVRSLRRSSIIELDVKSENELDNKESADIGVKEENNLQDQSATKQRNDIRNISVHSTLRRSIRTQK